MPWPIVILAALPVVGALGWLGLSLFAWGREEL